MIRWTASGLMVLIISSCATQKNCLKRFPVQTDTVEVVHYRDSIAYRDTVITIHIPGDTITDSIPIPCPPPPPQFIPDTATAETSLAVAWAWFDRPFVRLKLVQTDTTIELRLDSALRSAYYWEEKYQTVTAVSNRIPKIYRIALWSWIGFFVLILLSFVKYLFGRK